jgi:hypothetical protein
MDAKKAHSRLLFLWFAQRTTGRTGLRTTGRTRTVRGERAGWRPCRPERQRPRDAPEPAPYFFFP